MSSVLHFKFRSALLTDTVNFDGDHVSLGDLKRLIAKRKGLLKAIDIDFAITNADTGEEYTDEAAFIPKNTSVLVKKVNAKPQLDSLRGAPKTTPASTVTAEPKREVSPTISLGGAPEAANKQEEQEDEEAKLRELMESQHEAFQQTQRERRQMQQQPQQFARFGGAAANSGQTPPAYYICNRCEKPGHWKKNCPTLNDPAFDQKKFSVGIPISRTRVITEADAAASGDGVMRLPDGRLVQCMPSEADFARAIGGTGPEVVVPTDGSIPKELQCAMSKDLIEDAVVLPCCQSNVSKPLVTPKLSDNGVCPICFQPDITPDDLKPNAKLRERVKAFLKAALNQGIRVGVKAQASNSAAAAAAAAPREETVLPPPSSPPIGASGPANASAASKEGGDQDKTSAKDAAAEDELMGLAESKDKEGGEGDPSDPKLDDEDLDDAAKSDGDRDGDDDGDGDGGDGGDGEADTPTGAQSEGGANKREKRKRKKRGGNRNRERDRRDGFGGNMGGRISGGMGTLSAGVLQGMSGRGGGMGVLPPPPMGRMGGVGSLAMGGMGMMGGMKGPPGRDGGGGGNRGWGGWGLPG